MISQRDLSLISNDLYKDSGGRRIPDQTIELDYALGWFLSELSQNPFGTHLAFKGGTALRRCYFGEYRFSEDLDFTLLNSATFDEVVAAFNEVGESVRDASGMDFVFARPDGQQRLNSHTFYMEFTGPMRRARTFKVDMTINETIVHDLEMRPILATYDAYDFPSGCTVKTYSVEEIATEKIVALTDKARSQPRDLFDIWKLHEEFGIELAELANPIAQKLAFRGRDAENLENLFSRKEAVLKATWSARLDPQMSSTPPFDGVFREVKRAFRQSDVFSLVQTEHQRLKND
ncbi:nucleotidyl transferase AbiEii/AbiGii toxin family protein [Labrenzia sp. 011]|uniref:nucleotidyl transferase AbiEii/AbiGii toxin family protein n=1 Tax=Labrenzia sp. 011 TaxID=2171494 RepID=UPI000D506E48|nr:nucleotidyl transferase AbiEii/AbiGii toxin family protein [Labrenzia sp. 011]PVB60991.1 nucleotidyl transferase AbiEii/AbiGii toxin family protein [Labrenzia sp. 011]